MEKKLVLFFLFLIFTLSIFLHFFRLSYPDKVVFDEQWYASSAASYLSHKYYFDAHPPLGKILIAASGIFFGFKDPSGNFYFNHNESYLSKSSYLPFRFLPAILGIFLPILGWFIVKELKGSNKAAFLCSAFLLFDNALLLQSRFVLLEIFLVFFYLLSIFLYLKLINQKKYTKKWYIFLILLGLSLGVVISIKWTGFIVLATIIFLEIIKLINRQIISGGGLLNFFQKNKKYFSIIFLGIFFLPLLIYTFSFFVHFSLLNLSRNPKNFSDPLLYINKEKEIKDSPYVFYYKEPDGNFFEKFFKVHKQMISIFSVTGDHPYSSSWWKWPTGGKAMLYYSEENVHLYLMGNPIVWFLGFFGIISIFFIPYLAKREKEKLPSFLKKPDILYFYFFSWLVFIGVKRTSFLYYYLVPLCLSIIIFSLCFDYFTKNIEKKKKNIIFGLILFIVFLSFVFYLPLTYGLPLSDKAFSLRLWFPLWK